MLRHIYKFICVHICSAHLFLGTEGYSGLKYIQEGGLGGGAQAPSLTALYNAYGRFTPRSNSLQCSKSGKATGILEND